MESHSTLNLNLSIRSKRAALFACIESGSAFWSHEISELGVEEVHDQLLRGKYASTVNNAQYISNKLSAINGDDVIDEVNSHGCFLITPEDDDWPTKVDNLANPPLALTGKGDRELLAKLNQSISIVGTREPTEYGLRVTSEIAGDIAAREWMVISGGAVGIDTAAHLATLDNSGKTISILANGLGNLYPRVNAKLFTAIEQSGLLLSEAMPTISAMPFRFLIRNRLIASLSAGTVVVEAAFRSGSLRTARDAAEIFRPVMAVPGLITSPTSEGCHRLIGERCAELITCAADIFDLVMPLTSE
jgi:DNA processing protein